MVSYLKGLRAKFRYFMGMVNGTNMNQKIVQRFFQRLFRRFRKLVLVNNKNKLVAKMDNYISYYYVPTMYIFMIYVLIFIAGVLTDQLYIDAPCKAESVKSAIFC